jgi:hypothetical protein
MLELLGYYRLARRYRVPSLFVMNKCEESAVLDDFREQLGERGWPDAKVFAIPRDDAAYEPTPQIGCTALREAVLTLARPGRGDHEHGVANRCADVLGRLRDRILGPLRADRRQVEKLLVLLRSLNTSDTGVDVGLLTQQLQRRMQERSVLYLMGPRRVLERVRQLPGLLARLPRTAWDLVIRGEPPTLNACPVAAKEETAVTPDFARLLADQFVVAQSRIDDALRSNATAQRWLNARPDSYGETKIDPSEAARIADEELADLKAWLSQRWDESPRDTKALKRLLKHLPGGEKATGLSEVAPYLLAVVVALHGALFGPVDLLIIGGFSLATWVGEKLSNEVMARTRRTNRRIRERFGLLTREQVTRVGQWLDRQVPQIEELDQLERLADEISENRGTE